MSFVSKCTFKMSVCLPVQALFAVSCVSYSEECGECPHPSVIASDVPGTV